jgi:hypothetical protein
MVRVPHLLFAALLTMSASAFAADRPQPPATGEAAAPSGSNATVPGNAPSPTVTEDKKDLPAPATTPAKRTRGSHR